MATGFLSQDERERLQSFPDELAAHFTLTGEDLRFVRDHRGAEQQLGVALQLCAPRPLGFVPEDLTGAPEPAVALLAAQLDVPARAVFNYGLRERTRRDHHAAVHAHLGYAAAAASELARLRAWLVERALEHDRRLVLFVVACEQLVAWRVERPSVDRLAPDVAWAREREHERTFELLAGELTPARVHALDALLVPDNEDGPDAAGVATRTARRRQCPSAARRARQAAPPARRVARRRARPRGAAAKSPRVAHTTRAPRDQPGAGSP